VWPEGVGATLGRTGAIDPAFLLFQKDAVVALLRFQKGVALPHTSRIETHKFFERDLKKEGHRLHLLFVYPNVAGRSSAAFAALGTPKLQPIAVPAIPLHLSS
jgi:hypothetical protein